MNTDSIRAHSQELSVATRDGSWEGLCETVIESVPVPVLMLDSSTRLILANRNFRFLFQCSDQAHPGASLVDFLPTAHADVLSEVMRETLETGPVLEQSLPLFTGEREALRYTVTTARTNFHSKPTEPTDEPAERGVVFVFREVSAGLQLSELREQDELKRFLFSTMLHDIKTPLAAIMNATELLPALMSEGSEATCKELLGAIDSSGYRIKQLLDDTSEYLRLRFPLQVERPSPLPLDDLIDPIIRLYQMQGFPHQFQLEIDGPCLVCGERNRLTRALDNLLSNAVKYCPEGGQVGVLVDGRSSPDEVQIRISDEGPGIPDEYLDKIWDPFYRVRNTRAEGTGLGLAITRHIIEGQQGRISVQSELGVGTTFTIHLRRWHDS